MQNLKMAIQQMIRLQEKDWNHFSSLCELRTVKKGTFISVPERVPQEVFFIQEGKVRTMVIDLQGNEQTIHFAIENQFIADYSAFMQRTVSHYYLQALTDLNVVLIPRNAIEWGYEQMVDGQKLGRLIAEFYFTYHDNRILNMYVKSAVERYNEMGQLFPGIHQWVPQKMIASYLGITPVHLSRLKKTDR